MKRLHLHIIIPVLAAILGISAALAVEKPLDVRDVMTAKQFRTAGLDKLSADQVSALNSDITNISTLAADNKTVDLENILTANQFHAAGLDMLSPEQVAALNDWVTGYLRSQNATDVIAPSSLVHATPTPTPATSLGASMLQTNADEPNSVQTKIAGVFLGWSGETVFTLANGEVWKQAEPSVFSTHLQDPVVVIKKLRFGYLLTLPGQGETVFVIRLH